MEQKPGWTYSFSDSLNMHVAVNDTSGVLYTEDKIMYTPQEARLFEICFYDIPREVHIVKKTFGGTVIQADIAVEELTESDADL